MKIDLALGSRKNVRSGLGRNCSKTTSLSSSADGQLQALSRPARALRLSWIRSRFPFYGVLIPETFLIDYWGPLLFKRLTTPKVLGLCLPDDFAFFDIAQLFNT